MARATAATSWSRAKRTRRRPRFATAQIAKSAPAPPSASMFPFPEKPPPYGPAGNLTQDHGRERQSTPAGVLSALRLANLFDLAGGGAAGVLHGTGGNLAPAP